MAHSRSSSSTTNRACAARSAACCATRATTSTPSRAAKRASSALARAAFDVVVLDVWLPGHGRPRDAGADARAAGRRAGRRSSPATATSSRRCARSRWAPSISSRSRCRSRRRCSSSATRCASGTSRPRTARCGRSVDAHHTMVGESYAMRAAARAGRDGGADQRPRADLRRERHRQGARGAHHPRAEPPARPARSSR